MPFAISGSVNGSDSVFVPASPAQGGALATPASVAPQTSLGIYYALACAASGLYTDPTTGACANASNPVSGETAACACLLIGCDTTPFSTGLLSVCVWQRRQLQTMHRRGDLSRGNSPVDSPRVLLRLGEQLDGYRMPPAAVVDKMRWLGRVVCSDAVRPGLPPRFIPLLGLRAAGHLRRRRRHLCRVPRYLQ